MKSLRIAVISMACYASPRPVLSTYYTNLIESLSALGHEVHLVTLAENEVPNPSVRVTKIHMAFADMLPTAPESGLWQPLHQGFRRLIARLRFAWRAYCAVRELDATEGLDAVIAPELFAQGLMVALFMPHLLLTQLHGPVHQSARFNPSRLGHLKSYLLSLPERLQAMRSPRLCVFSRNLRDRIAGDWGVPRSRMALIPNMVDRQRLLGIADAQPREIAGDYLLSVGRLERLKGAVVLADALPEILDAYPALRMVFAGRDYGQQSEIVRRNLRHRDRLVFLGRVEQSRLFGLMRHARLVVQPSLTENMSNAALEVMALGRPLIGTHGASFEEFIEDGVDGFLVPCGSASALREKIMHCLQLPNLEAVGVRAAASVSRFALDQVGSQLVDLLMRE